MQGVATSKACSEPVARAKGIPRPPPLTHTNSCNISMSSHVQNTPNDCLVDARVVLCAHAQKWPPGMWFLPVPRPSIQIKRDCPILFVALLKQPRQPWAQATLVPTACQSTMCWQGTVLEMQSGKE